MRVRSFEVDDETALVELWVACGLIRPWNDPGRDVARKLAHSAELLLVGEEDGELIGAVMAGYDGHRGWINYLAVHPTRQGSGFGRELMAAAEHRLLALGCPKVNLQVREDNAAARGFYEAIGYGQDAVVSYGKRLIPDD